MTLRHILEVTTKVREAEMMNESTVQTTRGGGTARSNTRTRRLTLLEALASEAHGVGIDRSNQTTQPMADASDQ